MMGAELTHRAEVKRLALFHHDPTSSGEMIWQAGEQAEAYLSRRCGTTLNCNVLAAFDGLSLEI